MSQKPRRAVLRSSTSRSASSSTTTAWPRRFEYNTDLFDVETVEQLAESYGVLLEEIGRDADQRIGEIELLGESGARARTPSASGSP